MSYLVEADVGEAFRPFTLFRQSFDFIPNLFRAQTVLPRVIEAEARVAGSVLLQESALTRTQKEQILLVVACASRNVYCVTAHSHMLRRLGVAPRRVDALLQGHRQAGLPRTDTALLDFALKLHRRPTMVGPRDIEALRGHGLSDEQILEVVLMTALTGFLCTLAVGLGVSPDFEPVLVPAQPSPLAAEPEPGSERPRPWNGSPAYLRAVPMTPQSFPPFAFLRDRFGFVPNIFRAQTLRPDVLEAEAFMIGTVLLSDDVLIRARKEYILLVISAANLNTYCVAVHCEMLRALGITEEVSDRIALDHRRAGLPEQDVALLDFALKLGTRPEAFGKDDVDGLRSHRFSDEQILEAIVMSALTNFLNTLQMGLGTLPDFEPRLVFEAGGSLLAEVPRANLPEAAAHPTGAAPRAGPRETAAEDEDAALVRRARDGDLSAFEALVRRNQARIYRSLLAITGSREDAEDCAQDAFLKAFHHIAEFQGASRFSTWLTRIAINEGLQRLRRRKVLESLDDDGEGGLEEFRPRQVQSWEEDPERLHSRMEIRALVERELMRLPAMYRLAVMLRDIEQLSTEEAAAAMGLPAATLKTRLLRARLMLREALAPHFTGAGKGGLHA